MPAREREPHLLDEFRLVCAKTLEVHDVPPFVLGRGAIYVRSADIKEVRPQPSDGVLGDVSGELLAGAAEQEHAYHSVGLPYPGGYFSTH